MTTTQSSAETDPNVNKDLWYTIFAIGHPALTKFQNLHRRLPSPPRCRMCYAPFRGPGGIWMKFMHKERCKRNPNYCNACDKFLAAFPGGADVELSMVFVDVRESTKLAEKLDPADWGAIVTKFYDTVCKVFYRNDGFVMDVIGDEVVAIYPPGFCGQEHARKAIEAAQDILEAPMPKLPDGTRIKVGVGVNTGISYVGSTIAVPHGQDDVRLFGDSMNTAARLAAAAGPGEALISEATWKAAGLETTPDVEERQIIAKGKERPVPALVLHEHS